MEHVHARHAFEAIGLHADTRKHGNGCRLPADRSGIDQIAPAGSPRQSKPVAVAEASGSAAIDSSKTGQPRNEQCAALLARTIVAANERSDPSHTESEAA